jgi:TRAP-type mannitol/chloroaromatic compound transport system permease small subunit
LYSLNLAQFSYLINESSSEMGLTHRWVVKSVLPVAMGLLAIQAMCRGICGFMRIIGMSLNIPVPPATMEEKNNEC